MGGMLLCAAICLVGSSHPLIGQHALPPTASDQLAADVQTPTSYRGIAEVIWRDPRSGYGLSPGPVVLLVDDLGRRRHLALTAGQIESAGGYAALMGTRLEVRGRPLTATEASLLVTDLRRVGDPSRAWDRQRSFHGPQPYVWILLRFAGNPSTPRPASWFVDRALGSPPSMDHYWREVSFDSINLQGSVVVDWQNLPHEHSYYVYDVNPANPGLEIDTGRIFMDVFALVDPIIDFRQFSGMNMCFNDTLNCCSIAWRSEFTLDGETRYWGWTMLADWGWANHNKISHEMGHSFWLPHSTGPGPEIGDSWWDIMSHDCGTCQGFDPQFGQLGVGTIAYNKKRLDWIHPDHQLVLPVTPAVESAWLNDLAAAPPAGRKLLAQSRHDILSYYTVERRALTGYDQFIPDAAVIIHEVVNTREEPAWVVDADGNGNCNDEGARWDLGETFWDESHSFVVTVEDVDASGSLVTLSNAGRHAVYVDQTNLGFENGTSADPWNSVYEGYGSVYPHGNVYIAPSSYDEAMVFCKPATLQRWGSSGVVVIGE
jgi:hypothetical protein